MDTTPNASSSLSSSPRSFGQTFAAAARFWETWRLAYNFVLLAIFGTWVLATWPHFRGAFKLFHLFQLTILAFLANLCYCAAYAVDLPLEASSFAARWQRWRWALWLSGMMFAVLIESYWIADEIYPGVNWNG
jgi:hypothetical protein